MSGSDGGRTGPALGLIETASIARGHVVLDQMVKKAAVTVLDAWTASPGKYLVLVAGEVAEVEESMGAGLEAAAEHLLDQLLLPQPHVSIVPAIGGAATSLEQRSMVVVETGTAAATIRAADASVKAAEVELVELRLATGLGGKGYFVVAGELYAVEAAAEAAMSELRGDKLVNAEIIANPHPDMSERIR